MNETYPKTYITLNDSNTYSNEEIFINKQITMSKQITEEDISKFIRLNGDNNPFHHDDDFSKTTMIKGRNTQGLLGGWINSFMFNKTNGIRKRLVISFV